MTVWVLYQSLTPQEESTLRERPYVTLPLENLPDLSRVTNLADLRRLLQVLHAEAPPETVTRLADRAWKYYSELQPEDIVAVPLKSKDEVALAEVTGKYEHRMGDGGEDIHTVPVKWHKKPAPMRLMKKLKIEHDQKNNPMIEVTMREGKIALMDYLPYSYNRFSKWKWAILIFAGIQGLSYIIHMFNR